MKWTDPSAFVGGVILGAFLFAACGNGTTRPPETGSSGAEPESLQVRDPVEGTPTESKPPDTPPDTFEGNPGKAREEGVQTAPVPAGSGPPAVGGPK